MKAKNWANWLIFATIIISVVRYSAAFAASDMGQITGSGSELVTFLVGLTGIGMGILDTAGGGFLFSGWSRTFPRNGSAWTLKFKVLTICVFSLITSGMIILVPFTMSRLAQESVLVTLGGKSSIWAWLWSAMVNFIPYVIIAGVFTGNRMVEQLDVPESSRNVSGSRTEDSESSGKLPETWRQVRPRLSVEDVTNLAYASTADVMKAFHVSERTARNFRAYAREEINIPR
jgi:hypothetical protein